MRMSVVSRTNGLVELTVCHPGGSVRLRAPDDVPLGELMCDFLECTGQADGDWILSSEEDGGEYPAGRTLAQLEVRDGARLRLSERISASAPAVTGSPAGDAAVERGAAGPLAESVQESAEGVEELGMVEEPAGRVTLIDKPSAGEAAAGGERLAVARGPCGGSSKRPSRFRLEGAAGAGARC